MSSSISMRRVYLRETIAVFILLTMPIVRLALAGAKKPQHQIQCDPYRVDGPDGRGKAPDCKYYTQEPTGNITRMCLKQGVLRIVGEFNLFHINCTASYPLDFNFDGIRPTEAVKLLSRRRVNVSADKPEDFLYELNVSVYSIPALRTYYEYKQKRKVKISSSKKYSRTGEYIVSGFFQERASISTRMYIFFEEPDATADFIKNENLAVMAKKDQFTVIPCRPTHYEASVSLYENYEKIEWPLDSSVGFKIKKEALRNVNTSFTCLLEHNSISATLVVHSFGEMKRRRNHVHMDAEVRLNRPYLQMRSTRGSRVKVNCHISHLDGGTNNSALLTVGAQNPARYKLKHTFVWPEHVNRSYSVIVGGHPNNRAHDDVISVELDGYLVQSAFCGNEHKNISTSISTIVRGEPHTFEFDEDWSLIPRNELDTSSWFFPEQVKRVIYQNEEIEFRMQISTFVFIPPCIWHVEYKNGSILKEHINEDWNEGLCTFTKMITTEIRNITCSASMWSKNEWWNSSMGPSLNIQVCTPPSFDLGEPEQESFILNSTLHLKCTAYGSPRPEIVWLRNGRFITNPTRKYSVFASKNVQRHQEGEYFCLATNHCDDGWVIKKVTVHIPNDFEIYVWMFMFPAMFLTAYLILYIHYRKSGKARLSKLEINTFFRGDSSATFTQRSLSAPYNKKYEISRSRFQIDETHVLGTGEYGIVYYGLMDSKPVAIKAVKDKDSALQIRSLMTELKILQHIDKHENLIQLLGARTVTLNRDERRKLFLFVEYCPLGSLETFLRREKAHFGTSFTIRDMYLWGIQMANGMAHLGSKNLVHGDLATRNVLLTADKQVKITDFGLSKKLYTKLNFKMNTECKVAWPWLAVESLTDYTFSIESDVWAYGVSLWEIFSFAQVPFQETNFGQQFIEQLQNGQKRLEKPLLAPDAVYQIMLNCWETESSKRPTFQALSAQLTSLMGGAPGYTTISVISSECRNQVE